MTDTTLDALDFTAAEIATLCRFEETPDAPESRVIDASPLVPTGQIRPADEVAPQPDLVRGTAAEWSAHYLADAYAHAQLGRYFVRTMGDFRAADFEEVREMSRAYERLAELFSLGLLFRHVSDEVARELGEILKTGETVEVLWNWLSEAGINPHHIKTAPTHAELQQAAERRLAAHRSAAKESR